MKQRPRTAAKPRDASPRHSARIADMKFSLRQEFPAGLARLWTVFGRPEYTEQKYRSLGSTALRILKFAATDEVIEVELERNAPVALGKLPAWAQVLSGKQQTMRHHSRWERASPKQINAELDISPVGLPLNAHCIGSVIEVSRALSRMTLEFDVNCNVPTVGTKLARLFAGQVKEALRADHAFTLAYLEAISSRSRSKARST
jgi:hypothetical protein